MKAKSPAALTFIRHGGDKIGICVEAVGDENLTSVQQPAISHIHSFCLLISQIASCGRLRYRKSAELFSLQERNQIFLLLFLVPKAKMGKEPRE